MAQNGNIPDLVRRILFGKRHVYLLPDVHGIALHFGVVRGDGDCRRKGPPSPDEGRARRGILEREAAGRQQRRRSVGAVLLRYLVEQLPFLLGE